MVVRVLSQQAYFEQIRDNNSNPNPNTSLKLFVSKSVLLQSHKISLYMALRIRTQGARKFHAISDGGYKHQRRTVKREKKGSLYTTQSATTHLALPRRNKQTKLATTRRRATTWSSASSPVSAPSTNIRTWPHQPKTSRLPKRGHVPLPLLLSPISSSSTSSTSPSPRRW